MKAEVNNIGNQNFERDCIKRLIVKKRTNR